MFIIFVAESVPHLHILVTVGTIVNDGEGLLKTGSSDTDDICNQLTDCNHHLHNGQAQRT